MRNLCVISLFLWEWIASGQTFTWPSGTNVTGPYQLLSVISNATVFTPNSSVSVENDILTHKYQHHTRILWDSGLTYLAFSSACTNEGDGGEQSVFCVSSNRGATWSDPVLACPSQSQWINTYQQTNQLITYPRNWQKYNDAIYLICAVDGYGIYQTNKTNYVAAALVGVQVSGASVVGSPFLISTNAYTAFDGKTTPLLNSTLRPPLMSYSQLYGCWGGSYVAFTQSEWWGWYNFAGVYLVEPNTFSADGGTNNYYRLWRSFNWITTNLWQQVSSDGGVTWTGTTNTSIPNSPSETAAIRMTDGRFAIVGNPMTGSTSRDPLFLAITDTSSTAITNVWAIRQGLSSTPIYAGFSKSGGAAYPGVMQVGNYIYVSYSMQKESIGFSRVLVPGLADDNSDAWPPPVNISVGTATVGTLRTAP